MILQNQFPYDTSILGLENIYHLTHDGSHYINNEKIQTQNKILAIGRQCLIGFMQVRGSEPIVHKVKVLDAFYHSGIVHLFIEDAELGRMVILDIDMQCPKTKCTWVLFDITEKEKLLDYLAIKLYCQGCDDSVDITDINVPSKSLVANDDLLEFDF
jgi:hypothetical protein